MNFREAIWHKCTKTRFCQASTSELYGQMQEVPKRETAPVDPHSSFGVAKPYGYWIVKNYREAYGHYACNGIFFNHESSRRGEAFVIRKITLSAARIKHGLQVKLMLGNLAAKRDWAYAPEDVEAMWRMLQANQPEDFVIATGETHTAHEFLEEAFSLAGQDWRAHVVSDPAYSRPTEVDLRMGDPSGANARLGWEPKVKFKELVRLMMAADLEQARQEARAATAT